MSDTSIATDIVNSEAASEARLTTIVKKFARHRLGLVGLAVILVIVFCAALADVISPFDPTMLDYMAMIAPPSPEHWLGTDEIGRDILSRLIYGTRVSLIIVVFSILLSLMVGGAIGLIAGFLGGWVDSVVMRIMDGLLAFPLLVLALGVVAVLGPDVTNAVIALSVVNVPGFARLVRGLVLSVRELDFVQAARSVGAGNLRIMVHHIWPSIAGNVIVYASLRASSVLIAESSLAFLGLGAPPPTPTWGQMLATAIEYGDAWWISVFPGLAIFFSALAFNFFGDGLRDAMDVKLQD